MPPNLIDYSWRQAHEYLRPLDSAAKSLVADDIAATILSEAATRGLDVTAIRNGTRGMIWREPLVEIETDKGRVGYGAVDVADVPAPLDGKLESLDLTDFESHGGLAGLRGRGGAGFPTGIKWNTVLAAPKSKVGSYQNYIVCNADEGDSGTFADHMIMQGDPFTLTDGMIIAGMAVEATKGYVYPRSEYTDAIDIMGKAVVFARDAGILGMDVIGSSRAFDMEIRIGAGPMCAVKKRRC